MYSPEAHSSHEKNGQQKEGLKYSSERVHAEIQRLEHDLLLFVFILMKRQARPMMGDSDFVPAD